MTAGTRRLTDEDRCLINQMRPIHDTAFQVVHGPNSLWSVLFSSPPMHSKANYVGVRRLHWIALNFKRLYVPERSEDAIFKMVNISKDDFPLTDEKQERFDLGRLDCHIQHYKSVTPIFVAWSLAYLSLCHHLSSGSDAQQTLLKIQKVFLLILSVGTHFYCRHQIYLCSKTILGEDNHDTQKLIP
ncbi:MAG: hypothetical protein RLZZ453_795 [Chlamydiota bacterium]|jgi:hypothetical protein